MTNISVMRLLPLLLIIKIMIIITALGICTIIFNLGAQSNTILFYHFSSLHNSGAWDYYSCFSCGGNKRELNLLLQECKINKLVVVLSNILSCFSKCFWWFLFFLCPMLPFLSHSKAPKTITETAIKVQERRTPW